MNNYLPSQDKCKRCKWTLPFCRCLQTNIQLLGEATR